MNPNPQAATPEPHDDDARAWLSALVDGDAQASERGCRAWRDDEQARRDWHAYHLIGDVMRSEELAVPAARDAAFLSGLRARLAAEPVVLAPEPVAVPPRRRRQAWLLPVAAAAGFVMVAGVLVVTRVGQPGGAVGTNSEVALRSPADQRARTQQVMLRNAQFDQYVNAHRAVGGVSVSAPGGVLRRVDLTVPATPER
jgi:sigma-E factor negative regulatory protein RseA